MTNENLTKKDQVEFDGQTLDVRYHTYKDMIVLDKVTKAGTEDLYSIDSKDELKDKLSGRF